MKKREKPLLINLNPFFRIGFVVFFAALFVLFFFWKSQPVFIGATIILSLVFAWIFAMMLFFVIWLLVYVFLQKFVLGFNYTEYQLGDTMLHSPNYKWGRTILRPRRFFLKSKLDISNSMIVVFNPFNASVYYPK